jgi:hypothetical protein
MKPGYCVRQRRKVAVCLFAESDYLICAAPLTAETDCLGAAAVAGTTMVFINLGRGTVVDSDALITALTTGTIKGAGRIRPSPAFASSSYCMDYRNWFRCTIWTTRFILATATEFFVTENLPRFMRGESLLRVCHNHSAISAQAAIQHNGMLTSSSVHVDQTALHTF